MNTTLARRLAKLEAAAEPHMSIGEALQCAIESEADQAEPRRWEELRKLADGIRKEQDVRRTRSWSGKFGPY